MRLQSVLGLAFGVAAAGCGRLEDEVELMAEQALDSQELTSSESALTTMMSDGIEPGLDPVRAAEMAASRMYSRLQPAGCVTAAQSGATVTYQMNGCTGPYGLVRVTGTLQAVFASAPAGLSVDVTGDGLQVNGATMDVSSTAALAVQGSKRTLTVTTQGTGTGARGHALARDGQYTATRDTATGCITLDGTWSLDIGARGRSTVVSGLGRCEDRCPQAGGSIVHQGLAGRVITVTFDGSTNAKWDAKGFRRDLSGSIALTCTQ